ncbi:pentapeptide repeat-containing protein [Alginatibacterium sediminis]|uniref:pentapeptide repeat-containing protein n=1 Tax=Alginatibacterium sediminis TaxID=2164068 RepID=UPI0011C4AC28|nr:pentapeptide repeat-containing protein [Alginatibacterium sediminis]
MNIRPLSATQLWLKVFFPLIKRALSLGLMVYALWFFHYSLLDVSDWQLQQSDYYSQVERNWTRLLSDPSQVLKFSICIMFVVIGFRGFVFPVLKALYGFVPQWASTLSVHYKSQLTVLKSWFSNGADIIDKGSMWLLLISLTVYLFNDREVNAIDSSWETIYRAQGKWGDLGRRDALATLIDYDVSIIGVDLSHAVLNQLVFDGEHDDYWIEPDRAMLDLVILSYTDLSFSSFPCVFMRQANLQGAKLSGVRFSAADLRDSQFNNSDFGGKIVSQGQYVLTDFSFADLRGADLSDDGKDATEQTSPYGKYQDDIQAQGAWFIGADLRGTKLGQKALGIGPQADARQLDFVLSNLKAFARWDDTTEFPPLVQRELQTWQGALESTTIKEQRWNKLVDIYQNSFGEDRAQRLRSYRLLSVESNAAKLLNPKQSFSDLSCQKTNRVS